MNTWFSGWEYYDETTIDFIPIVITEEQKLYWKQRRADAQARHGREFLCDRPLVQQLKHLQEKQ